MKRSFNTYFEAYVEYSLETGAAISCDTSASQLLGVSSGLLLTEWWRDSLSIGDSELIQSSLADPRQRSIPPCLLRRSDGKDTVVVGRIQPVFESENKTLKLQLWSLAAEGDLDIQPPLASTDVLGVLGLDDVYAAFDSVPSATGQILNEVRGHLERILRPIDAVVACSSGTVVMALRDLNTADAEDICRALLAHLHSVDRWSGSSERSLRFAMGLVSVASDDTALASLVKANTALLFGRLAKSYQPITLWKEKVQLRAISRLVDVEAGFAGIRAVDGLPTTSKVSSKTPKEDMQPIALEPAVVVPLERGIDGYVMDNMEGAVDQALFLASLEMPVAIIGPSGTGKMYIAKVLHEATGTSSSFFEVIDCRDFRSRRAADAKISATVAKGEGKTLVLKSPHLLHVDVQKKLAKQLASRRLADANPPTALPKIKFVALFPQPLEQLLHKGELTQSLASAFAGYPIVVPPLKDRKRAVLRWAHKILAQEGIIVNREMRGFTSNAEQALLTHQWPGNISELRQCIHDAIRRTEKNWLTPLDLRLFEGVDPDGGAPTREAIPFLLAVEQRLVNADGPTLNTQELLENSLGTALNQLLQMNSLKPLGTWLEDELVVAALDRYGQDVGRAAEFLHTKPRNVHRWKQKIVAREDERDANAVWQEPRRLLKEWVRESAYSTDSPMDLMRSVLMRHLVQHGDGLTAAKCAQVMGVSTPTYLKRLREFNA